MPAASAGGHNLKLSNNNASIMRLIMRRSSIGGNACIKNQSKIIKNQSRLSQSSGISQDSVKNQSKTNKKSAKNWTVSIKNVLNFEF